MSHIDDATTLATALRATVTRTAQHLAEQCEKDGRVSTGLLDRHQTVAYELASVAAATSAAEALLAVTERDPDLAPAAHAWGADVHADLLHRLAGRRAAWGLPHDDAPIDAPVVRGAATAGRTTALLHELAARVLDDPRALRPSVSEGLAMVRDTFRRFAEEKVAPVAEDVHRHDRDVPEEIIGELAAMGCFALSVPAAHGGMATGGPSDLQHMVMVTEELSRGSLGVAGSLITRPEIIAAAVDHGGTDEQKQRWLPSIASGEKMCAVAVTEPDHGSDVAGITTTARRDGDDWMIDGVKTWCTFAGRAEYLLALARTDPDRSRGHRGLSLFVVDKPRHAGHGFRVEQDGGGAMEGTAIPTIGYRGMHSFEVSFDSWRVSHRDLIGEDAGVGRGFYLQMHAFDNARLQTAARALGVMQAALDEAVLYTKQRRVFGQALADFDLTRTKIARMALLVAACRASTTDVAGRLATGTATRAAAEVKQLSCRVAEWVTREAQQLHGGYGYAEEYTVSRLFVDARVLSIFEGADEVLALRVVAKQLLQACLDA